MLMETKDLPKRVPEAVYEFEVDVEGSQSRAQFQGKFKYRIPNLKARAQAAVMEAKLNSGVAEQLDASVKMLHNMISYLKYTLEAAPKWWVDSDSGYELHDFNVILTIYQDAQKFEEEWLKSLYGDPKSGGESK